MVDASYGAVVTSWVWAQLEPGQYALPGPAVVMSPWLLEAREPRPARRGFTRLRLRQITSPRPWQGVGTAKGVVVDYPHSGDMLVVAARRPDLVDGDVLRDLQPDTTGAGVKWSIPTIFPGPSASSFHNLAHEHGRVLLLTGDLSAHHAALRNNGGAPPADQVWAQGCWAAWAPLTVRLYQDGVGTRPA